MLIYVWLSRLARPGLRFLQLRHHFHHSISRLRVAPFWLADNVHTLVCCWLLRCVDIIVVVKRLPMPEYLPYAVPW